MEENEEENEEEINEGWYIKEVKNLKDQFDEMTLEKTTENNNLKGDIVIMMNKIKDLQTRNLYLIRRNRKLNDDKNLLHNMVLKISVKYWNAYTDELT